MVILLRKAIDRGGVVRKPIDNGDIATSCSRSGELRTQKLKSYLVRTQSLKVLHLKRGVGQYLAIHASLTASEFFLISTLPVHSSAFSKTYPNFFLC